MKIMHSLALIALIIMPQLIMGHDLSADLYNNILLADYYSACNNHSAEGYYSKVLAYHGTSETYQSYIKHLFDQKKFDAIIDLAKKRPQLFESSGFFELNGYMLAHAYESKGMSIEANELFEKLAQLYKDNYEIIYYAAKSYISAQKHQRAIDIIQDLFTVNNQAKFHYIFHFLLYKAFAEMKDYKRALESIEKSISLQPNFEQGWLMLAMLQEQLGNIAQAHYGYNRFVDLTGDRSIEAKLIALQPKQHVESPLEPIKKKLCEKNFHYAQSLMDSYLHEHPDDENAQLLQLDIYMMQEDYHKAYNYISSMVNKKKSELWFKIAHLFYINVPNANQKRLMRNFFYNVAFKTDNLIAQLYALDIALRYDKKNVLRLAQRFLNQAQDTLLSSKVLYHVLAHFYTLRDFKTVKNLMDNKIISLSEYPPLINFAAYYYATKGKNLDVAQKFLDKIGIGDPHYEDTQGLIEYKKKNYTDAYVVLKSAVQKLPTNSIILRHLAKVSAKLGYSSEAIDLLKRATIFESSPEKNKQLQALISGFSKATNQEIL